MLLFLFAVLGSVCQWFYEQSPSNAIPINDVRYNVAVKQRRAEQKMREMEALLERNSLDCSI